VHYGDDLDKRLEHLVDNREGKPRQKDPTDILLIGRSAVGPVRYSIDDDPHLGDEFAAKILCLGLVESSSGAEFAACFGMEADRP